MPKGSLWLGFLFASRRGQGANIAMVGLDRINDIIVSIRQTGTVHSTLDNSFKDFSYSPITSNLLRLPRHAVAASGFVELP